MIYNEINLKKPSEDHLYDDYSYFVYGLVKQYKPSTTFEIGLGPTANSTCAIVQALIENNEHKNKYNGFHYVLDISPEQKALEKIKNLDKNYYDLRIGDSKQHELYCNLKGLIDILFVDGNHTMEYCYNDTALPLYLNSFNVEDGLIVFHDTKMTTVLQAIKKLKTDFNLETFVFPKISIAVAKIIY